MASRWLSPSPPYLPDACKAAFPWRGLARCGIRRFYFLLCCLSLVLALRDSPATWGAFETLDPLDNGLD
jgi:hypothetical protein